VEQLLMAPSASPIRVLIADDHRFFRESLCQSCKLEEDIQVVGEAENGQEAVELARHTRPDVILMDLEMPILDGVQATRLITKNNPETRVIVLTIHPQDKAVRAALKAGARGYLSKGINEQALIKAVRAVYLGKGLT
jgi:two-component system response regulator DegU